MKKQNNMNSETLGGLTQDHDRCTHGANLKIPCCLVLKLSCLQSYKNQEVPLLSENCLFKKKK